MVRQPSWEQERPVSAPAVRPGGCHPTGGLGASSPISGIPVKWARAERESERPIWVPAKRGNERGLETEYGLGTAAPARKCVDSAGPIGYRASPRLYPCCHLCPASDVCLFAHPWA
jgi:hypothetical protein